MAGPQIGFRYKMAIYLLQSVSERPRDLTFVWREEKKEGKRSGGGGGFKYSRAGAATLAHLTDSVY